MFATIVSMNRLKWRSSFFANLDDAIEYAERMFGIESIEEIGVGTVWTRCEENNDVNG